jgi:hypothetical protein
MLSGGLEVKMYDGYVESENEKKTQDVGKLS